MVEHFKEFSGEGVQGTIHEITIKLGGAQFVQADKTGESTELSSKVYVSIGGLYLGYFSVDNKYRNGLADLLGKLQHKYEAHLISGDNEGEKEKLLKWFRYSENLHFNQKPQQKFDYIKQLQSKKKTVLMIGDGLNDAGALHQSEVGVTIADDIYNFSPACDGILESGQFASLHSFLKLSKSTINIVKISFLISFFYNFVGLAFAVNGYLTPIVAAILMPVSSVTIVVFVTLATNAMAFFSKQKVDKI